MWMWLILTKFFNPRKISSMSYPGSYPSSSLPFHHHLCPKCHHYLSSRVLALMLTRPDTLTLVIHFLLSLLLKIPKILRWFQHARPLSLLTDILTLSSFVAYCHYGRSIPSRSVSPGAFSLLRRIGKSVFDFVIKTTSFGLTPFEFHSLFLFRIFLENYSTCNVIHYLWVLAGPSRQTRAKSRSIAEGKRRVNRPQYTAIEHDRSFYDCDSQLIQRDRDEVRITRNCIRDRSLCTSRGNWDGKVFDLALL